MREIRLSGSMSGRWKRGRVQLVRHRQTKGPDNRLATPKPPRHLSTLPRALAPSVNQIGDFLKLHVSARTVVVAIRLVGS
jgi:hypothetical protein